LTYNFKTMIARIGSDPAPLNMRMSNTFAMAHVTRIDDSGEQRLLQVKLRTGEIEDDIAEFRPAGIKHKKQGETLLVRFGGQRRNTMAVFTDSGVVGGDYLQDGDVALDDDRGLHIWFSADGIVIEANGLPVTIKNTTKLRVEGDIEATGEVTAKADGDAIPLSTHLTQNVQTGSGVSGPPKKP